MCCWCKCKLASVESVEISMGDLKKTKRKNSIISSSNMTSGYMPEGNEASMPRNMAYLG